MTKQEKKDLNKVTKVVSNVAKSKAAKKAKEIAAKEAQRIEILSRDSGTLSKTSAEVQAKIAKQKPDKPAKAKRGESTEAAYIEAIIISGEPFSVGEISKELNVRFQSVRAMVLRIAKRLGKTVSIKERGKWIAK